MPAAASADFTMSCAPSCTVTAGTEVAFTATTDGTVVGYAWDLDEDGNYGARDGEPEGPSANQVRRTFADTGRLLVAVRVRDPRGTLAFSRQLVTVGTAAEPPALPPGTPPLPGALPAPPGAAGLVFPAPPAAGADDDGDRVPTEPRRVSDSPAGRPARVGGCSVLDALIAPRAVIGLLGGPDDGGATGNSLSSLAEGALRRLGGGIADLRAAALELPDAPCGASGEAGKALRDVRRGLNGTDAALARWSQAIGSWGRAVGGGDAGVGDKDITICDNAQLIYSRSTPAAVRPDGYYAKAKYNRKQFRVDDGSPTDFDVAELKCLDASKLPGAGVFGVGYAVQGGASAYPQRELQPAGRELRRALRRSHPGRPERAVPRLRERLP